MASHCLACLFLILKIILSQHEWRYSDLDLETQSMFTCRIAGPLVFRWCTVKFLSLWLDGFSCVMLPSGSKQQVPWGFVKMPTSEQSEGPSPHLLRTQAALDCSWPLPGNRPWMQRRADGQVQSSLKAGSHPVIGWCGCKHPALTTDPSSPPPRALDNQQKPQLQSHCDHPVLRASQVHLQRCFRIKHAGAVSFQVLLLGTPL